VLHPPWQRSYKLREDAASLFKILQKPAPNRALRVRPLGMATRNNPYPPTHFTGAPANVAFHELVVFIVFPKQNNNAQVG
jgi:hypothetical protein